MAADASGFSLLRLLPLLLLPCTACCAAARARLLERWLRGGRHGGDAAIDPFIFHLTNILTHAGVTALVYRLALRLALSRQQQHTAGSSAAAAPPQGKPPPQPGVAGSPAWPGLEAGVAALLFAVHPIHTEAVAGIVGHAELLCAALAIPALLCYMTAADGRVGSPGQHWRRVAAAVGLGWAAALTKEIGITIVSAGRLCERCGRRSQLWLRVGANPVLLLLLLVLVLLAWRPWHGSHHCRGLEPTLSSCCCCVGADGRDALL